MFKVYTLVHSSGRIYVGQTKHELEKRFYFHWWCSRKNTKTYLHSFMKDTLEKDWTIVEHSKWETRAESLKEETRLIEWYGTYDKEIGFNRPYSEGNRGRKATPEALKNMSIALKNRKMPRNTESQKITKMLAMPHRKKIRCNETGYIFESITNASKQMNLNRPDIRKVLNNKRNHCGGYTFSYLT